MPNTDPERLPQQGDSFPTWQRGIMDLHHINTGRGDAAFYRLPDGTSMLVDLGELDPTSSLSAAPWAASPKPDSKTRPHEAVGNYIGRMTDSTTLDYALVTHFHDDHYGFVNENTPRSENGDIALTGITGLWDTIQIKCLVDRIETKPITTQKHQLDATLRNYLRFRELRQNLGRKNEAFRVGSAAQFVLKNEPVAFPGFEIRNICGNGTIWTGAGESTKRLSPANEDIPQEHMPGENFFSCGIRVRYGSFTLFTGADIPGVPAIGAPRWHDVETPVSQVIGPVDVLTMNHHGHRNTHNEHFVSTLRPRVVVQQNWSYDQPGEEVLLRLTSRKLYPGPRDLFANNLLDGPRYFHGPKIDRSYLATSGHIVVRVMPGGKSYVVIVLDDETHDPRVRAVHGPYEAR